MSTYYAWDAELGTVYISAQSLTIALRGIDCYPLFKEVMNEQFAQGHKQISGRAGI